MDKSGPITTGTVMHNESSVGNISEEIANDPMKEIPDDLPKESDNPGSSVPKVQEWDQQGPPEGGIQAWSACIGAFLVTFSTLGFMNCFGLFQQYYMTHQLRNVPADEIAWIGSITNFLTFAVKAVGGPLFDRYGPILVVPTTALYILAIMMLSISTEYLHFILTQGIFIGLTTAVMQSHVFAAVSQHFHKYRGTAFGIASSGSSIGGVVLPLVSSKLLNGSSIGFGWSIRSAGFLMIPLLIIACVTVKARLAPTKQSTFFLPTAFKNPTYNLIIAAMFLQMLGMMTPFFYLPTYATSRGMDATMASYLLAILNSGSTFGRIIPGICADKFGRINIFAISGIATAITLFCMTFAKSTAGFIIYAIAVGFLTGAGNSGGITALSLCAEDPREIGTYMGQGLAFFGIAALIGPPINGKLLAVYGDFYEASLFSGSVCLLGGLLALATKATTFVDT